jgi:hypothetical protein
VVPVGTDIRRCFGKNGGFVTGFITIFYRAVGFLAALCRLSRTRYFDFPQKFSIFAFLNYIVMKRSLIISVLAFFILNAVSAQKIQLKGHIVDQASLDPIPFVNVVLTNDSITAGVSSDISGNFIINDLLPGKYKIVSTFVGYQKSTTEIVLSGDHQFEKIQIKLKPTVQSLEEVEIRYTPALIDKDNTVTQAFVAKEDIVRIPAKGAKSNISNNPGSSSQTGNNGYNTGNKSSGIIYNDANKNISGNAILPQAGILTASELNDFSKWELWGDIKDNKRTEFKTMWEIDPAERYSVQVVNEMNHPVIDAIVVLKDKHGNAIWNSRTDNTGKAELWKGIFGITAGKELTLNVIFQGAQFSIPDPKPIEKGINLIKIPVVCDVPATVDIAFIVDATASMDDEILFLKAELEKIILQSKDQFPDNNFRLASVFYRCFGNSYVTRHMQFTKDVGKASVFINNQKAEEGGAEVVEEALRVAVDSLKWSENAKARIIFFVLDEQPLVNDSVLNTLHKYIALAAEKGIRIIPVVASAETMTNAFSMEYLMRSIALATNGRYVFLTDHSNVGGAHAKPTTDEYDVELLSDLITRLIYEFCYVPECNISNVIDSDTAFVFKEKKVIAHEKSDEKFGRIKEKKNKTIVTDFSAERDSSVKTGQVIDSVKMEEDTARFTTVMVTVLTYFPNPTVGELHIRADSEIKEILLTDISGKLLDKFSLKRDDQLDINLGKYSTGIYFLRFFDGEKWNSGKVILTH